MRYILLLALLLLAACSSPAPPVPPPPFGWYRAAARERQLMLYQRNDSTWLCLYTDSTGLILTGSVAPSVKVPGGYSLAFEPQENRDLGYPVVQWADSQLVWTDDLGRRIAFWQVPVPQQCAPCYTKPLDVSLGTACWKGPNWETIAERENDSAQLAASNGRAWRKGRTLYLKTDKGVQIYADTLAYPDDTIDYSWHRYEGFCPQINCHILFAGVDESSFSYVLYVNVETGKPAQFFFFGWAWPHISPSGRKVAFAVYHDDHFENNKIEIYNISGFVKDSIQMIPRDKTDYYFGESVPFWANDSTICLARKYEAMQAPFPSAMVFRKGRWVFLDPFSLTE